MRKTPLTERILAISAGRTRAAAIYGDLLELSATHTRLWFAAAYLRTLFALTWRTPVALILAVVSIEYMRGHVLGRLLSHLLGNSIPLASLGSRPWSHFRVGCWIVAYQTVSNLWILLPYVAIRFGLRNRLTYLACALFVAAVPVYALLPRAVEFAGVLTVLVTVAALASPLWRRPYLFLAINGAVADLVFMFCWKDPLGIYHHGLHYIHFLGMSNAESGAIAVAVIICPPLHRWLLEPPTPPAPLTLAPIEGANA